MRALAKSPDDRYQTAAEFRADVERAVVGSPVTAAVPAVVGAATQRIDVVDPTQVYAVDTAPMRIARRISATFKDVPGGQVLGATYDYTQRLLDFELAIALHFHDDIPCCF